MIENFYALEEPLAALLREVPGVQAVYKISDEAEMAKRQAARVPAVLVTYGGSRITLSRGASLRLTQRWVLAPAARSLAGTRDASAARDDIGPIVSRVILIAHRWDHGIEGLTQLELAALPPPQYVGDYLAHPLVFEAHTVVS